MDQAVMDLQEIITCHAERKLQEEIYCQLNIVGIINAINRKWHKNGTPILSSLTAKNTARNAKSEIETFFAKSIHASPNWEACSLDFASLDNIPEKADWLFYFLTTKRGGKNYRLLLDETDNENQFHIITHISAAMRTLEARYEEKRFADSEVKARIERIIILRQEKEISAETIGHAQKHQENVQTAIAPIMDMYQNRITDTFFPPYTRELPPLPQGVALPVDPVIRLITGRE